jgi:hypothetical protein
MAPLGRGDMAGAAFLELDPQANAIEDTPIRRRTTAGPMTSTRDQKEFTQHLGTERYEATISTPVIGDERASVTQICSGPLKQS